MTNKYLIAGIRENEIQENPNTTLIHIEDGSYIIYETKEEIILEYQSMGGDSTIRMKLIDQDIYEYTIQSPTLNTRFKHKKPLHHLGQSKACNLYKTLLEKLQETLAIPEGPYWDGTPEKRIKSLLESINYNSSGIKQSIDATVKVWLVEAKEGNIPSWFEAIGEVDDFSPELRESADEFLLQNNFVEHVYSILSKRVTAQKPKTILAFLIAMSSLFPKPLHSVVTGKPGGSKSTISEAVFEVFPKHRRLEIDPGTTEAGLLNMTKYKEGSHIFKNKLIKLGDWGDEQEQKETKFLMSFFKVLMSEGKYNKILTEMADDFGRATILRIIGCGSVNIQVVTPTVESQFQSRSVVWSPDDNKNIQNAIRDFHIDDVSKYKREYSFRQMRDIVAASIDKIFQYVESLTQDGSTFEVISPYNDHINRLLRVDDSPNANRDRLMVMMLPKLVTLSNCFHRQLYYNPEFKVYNLVVTAEDYQYTVKTLGKTLSFFIHKKSEALQTYLDIIEHKLGLQFDLTGNVKTALFDYDFLKGEANRHPKVRADEFKEVEDELRYFTYKDFSKHTTAAPKTVNRYVTQLDDLGVVVVDRFHTPHRVYIPRDYGECKASAFEDIFDPDKPVDPEKAGAWDIEAMSQLKDFSEIKSMENDLITGLLGEGWSKFDCPVNIGLGGV